MTCQASRITSIAVGFLYGFGAAALIIDILLIGSIVLTQKGYLLNG